MRTLIENLEFILTADQDNRMLKNASVVIEDDRIAEIGAVKKGRGAAFDEAARGQALLQLGGGGLLPLADAVDQCVLEHDCEGDEGGGL